MKRDLKVFIVYCMLLTVCAGLIVLLPLVVTSIINAGIAGWVGGKYLCNWSSKIVEHYEI